MLSPQATSVLSYMTQVGSISAQDAFLHMGQMTSSTLTRRICDLKRVGIAVRSERRHNPATGRQYTRYFLVTA